MIQRIQTLFLFLAAGSFAAACFLPVGTIVTHDYSYLFTSWCLKENIPEGAILYQTFYIGLLQAVLALLSLVSIFFFKKRPLQSRLCLAGVVMNFILVILMLWVYPEHVFPQLPQMKGLPVEVSFSYWSMLSVLPLAALYLANKFIIRDEKKVRAADRLR
jgi:hypothetical protein